MLKPINTVSNRVAEGRRFASRSIVVTSLSGVASYAFRREVIPAEDGKKRSESIYEGGMVLSSQEEHATEYKELGHAMMLFDHFSGGSIHNDGEDINSGEAVLYAQIEPIFLETYGDASAMLKNKPDWIPQKGDIFALIIDQDLIKWVECVGVTGQSLHSHYGEKYVLNIRDKLMHLDPFIDTEKALLPQSNPFPMMLNELKFFEADFYDVDLKDPTDITDDEYTARKFKLVNMDDQSLNYTSLLGIRHLAKATQSPYFFNAEDQSKIEVGIQAGEIFVLSSDTPVHAIQVRDTFISYVLVMINHVELVRKISEEFEKNNAVNVIDESGKIIFELLPTLYDEVRKSHHFICSIQLESIATYSLKFLSGEKHDLTIDASKLKAVLE